jgi:hypothetical protein
MSLRDTLKEIKAGAVERIPPEALEVMGEATRQLEASGQAERSIAVGERIPTFAVKGHDDVIVSSEDLLMKAPLVLLFYRGVW